MSPFRISRALARRPCLSQACASSAEPEKSSRTNLPFDNGSTACGSKTGTAEHPTNPPVAGDRDPEARPDGGGWGESRNAEHDASVVDLPRFLTFAMSTGESLTVPCVHHHHRIDWRYGHDGQGIRPVEGSARSAALLAFWGCHQCSHDKPTGCTRAPRTCITTGCALRTAHIDGGA